MRFINCLLLSLLLWSPSSNADIRDWFKRKTSTVSVSDDVASSGIREALTVGVGKAIEILSADGGFLYDHDVRIRLPDALRKSEKTLRRLGQGDKVDDLINTMNRAAESAVAGTTELFVEAIESMTLKDVQAILRGGDHAATDYFREHSQAKLQDVILPVVQDATSQTGVSRAYKEFVGGNALFSLLGGGDELDLDQYITDRAIDGLFLKLAEQEEMIREDPLARSTDLLKQVFGN